MHKDDKKFLNSVEFHAFDKPSLVSNILYFIIILFLAFFLIWISTSKIDEIVKGQGKIIPSSRIQSIQSVDGGTIQKISVEEGSFVKKGQELIVIDDIRFNSSVEELQNDLYSLQVKAIRLRQQSLLSDINNIPDLEYPDGVKKNGEVFIKSEQNYYKNQVTELIGNVNIERSKYLQKQQEYKEIKRKIEKLRKSRENIRKQLILVHDGVQKGVMSKIDELKLRKDFDETIGELEISLLALNRSKSSIDESRRRIKKEIDIFKTSSSKELVGIEAEIKKIEAKLTFSNDRLEKSVIYSPVDGIVNHIYFTTIGGVVREADVIMDIVPSDDSLLVEARIDPKDIGFIGPDNKVVVKVTAYDFSIYGGLEGNIEQIGADSILDKENKSYYYQVLIRTKKNFLGKQKKPLMIIPGMVCEVDIKTGKKTILNYMLKPIIKTVNNAMTER